MVKGNTVPHANLLEAIKEALMNQENREMIADDFPDDGRIAAIDYGTVRIGIAVCDPDRRLASPLEVRPAANWREDGDYYRSLVKDERLVALVVGLPIHLDGGESQKSAECRKLRSGWLLRQKCQFVCLMNGSPPPMPNNDLPLADLAAKRKKAG